MFAKGDFEDLQLSLFDSINEIRIGSLNLSGNITIIGSDYLLTNLILENISKNLDLTFENLIIKNINISRYRNESNLRFSHIKSADKISEFSITDSYLGKAEFYSVDFASFGEVNILNSFIADSVFINSNFPDNINAFESDFRGRTDEQKNLVNNILTVEKKRKGNYRLKYNSQIIEYYSNKRETYRQIKYALSKQGDALNEQKFHALEMNAYNRTLTIKNNFWTKLIIKASSFTSNFGQSILKPLAALLIGHWILLMILIACGNFSNLSLNGFDKQGFRFAFEKYFQLINPLHRNEVSFEGYLIIIDILMRIWASYMIYNIIRASRRFIK